MNEFLILRVSFAVLVSAAGYFLRPFDLSAPAGAGIGLTLGAVILAFEHRIKQVSLKRLIGAAFGSVLGILGAYLISLVIGPALPKDTAPFAQVSILLWMAYCGLAVGAEKGDLLNLAAFGGVFGGDTQPQQTFKILDTSVIIDGRIADIAETGFLEGPLVIPQFVLRELQLVADSSDSGKRNRGRRGLDILARLQNNTSLRV